MLGVSGMMGSSGEGGGAAEQPHENGGASGGSSEVGGSSSAPLEEIEKSGGGGGGNRWPRQETLALLQIRHDMDSVFRDSSLKGPLWEEVSRKMAELGFQRSAKKCKEKFENVFKYHKRTRDGRATKPDGKTYRFFKQLEALENTPPTQFTPPPPRATTSTTTTTMAAPAPNLVSMPPHVSTSMTNNNNSIVPSTSPSPTPISVIPPPQSSNPQLHLNPITSINTSNIPHQSNINFQHHHMMSTSFMSNSTSSSTSSDEGIQRRCGGKKRKWKDYFERLMRDIVQKQEDMQMKFLDALERRDRDRIAREEAWRVQELNRVNRERELLVKEREKAAAKDDAMIAFLQKVADQHSLQVPINFTTNNVATPTTMTTSTRPSLSTMQVQSKPPQPPPAVPQPQLQQSTTFTQPPPILNTTTLITKTSERSKTYNGGGENYNIPSSSSSRWPKAEVQALINLRTSLDLKYQENGPKGPLWEEISSEMSKLGYSRSAKRCKEKWENINKYYKKVKESNKKRPDDSKTCPYFHQLEAIYKARNEVVTPTSFNQVSYGLKTENSVAPIMVRPEQQWPSLPQQQQGGSSNKALMDEHHQHDHEHNENTEDNEDDIEDEEDDEEDDDDDQGGGYEMIPNTTKQTTPNTVE